ncbi:MAG: hypothetical protein GY848_05170, partial [Methyloversatilis sp.]|nr:hypothetical protein [Methyloversatilis sp.]
MRELGPQRGAEELPRHLNRVYDAVIAEVHRYGGSVLSFSGDAVTCWLDDPSASDAPSASGQAREAGDVAPAGVRAIACGLAIQQVMAQFGAVTTPAGTAFSLSIKVAAVAGPVRRFLVGDPAIQTIEAIAGQTLDELAATEQCAERGQVLVPAGMIEAAGGLVEFEGWRQGEGT